MSARLCGMRLSSTWLAGAISVAALIAAWPAAAQVPGFVEVQVEPAAPAVVPPAPTAPAPTVAEAPVEGLSLPEMPQVVVEVPAAEPPRESQAAAPAIEPTREAQVPAMAPLPASLPPATPEAAPVRAAEAPPAATAPSPAEELSAAIQRRLADPALPLPPRFPARERESLAAAYASGQPLWVRDGAFVPAAERLVERLAEAAEDGLDPADYPVPRLAAGASAAELAEAELKLSAAAYLYARDARGGRLEPNRLGGLITPKLDLPGVERVLATLAASEDPGATLHGFNPRYPGYAALREKLADLRAHRPAAGTKQQRAGTVVATTGAIGGLQSRYSPRIEGDLVANMERWRWLPSQVGERHILVNIPEFRLRLIDEGRTIHEARVITGKTATPTPIFSDLMDHAIVNPSWFVPPSILKKMDVGSAARQGYHVTQRRGVTSVRMPPGPRNALGYIKFMFPNDHAVYLHDTPNRGLFGSSSRALSHGCVRVEHPFALGGKILGAQWTEGRLKSLIGSGERMIKLDERLPIHLAYFTLYVDESGDLRSFGDLYGYHGRVRRALGLGS